MAANSCEKALDRLSGELVLGDEAENRSQHDAVAVGRDIPARDEDHRWGRRVRCQLFGDREPISPGQLDVEQDETRPKQRGLPESAFAVRGLAHDLETFGLQQRARRRAEAAMVVHDEDRRSHHIDTDRPKRDSHPGWHAGRRAH
jgi:hypothetical protein